MAKLTTAERNKLPDSDFAEPSKRKYPIEDKAHQRNALARVSQFGSAKEKSPQFERKFTRSLREYGEKSRSADEVAGHPRVGGQRDEGESAQNTRKNSTKVWSRSRAEKQRVAILLSKARKAGASVAKPQNGAY